MKKISVAIAAAALSATSALAADLPSRKGPPPAYLPPPPVLTWTGFYVGGNVGGGWTENYNVGGAGTVFNGFVWVPAIVPAGTSSGGGVVGGIQAGYNFQLSPMFVVGVETDFQGSSIGGSSGWTGGATRSIDWYGTVRGRVGLTMPGWQQFMIYGTGGFAYGDIRLNQGFFGGLRATGIGWTAGGGVEWALMPNWSIKTEYLYTNLGADTWGGANLAEHHVHFHTVRAGVKDGVQAPDVSTRAGRLRASGRPQRLRRRNK